MWGSNSKEKINGKGSLAVQTKVFQCYSASTFYFLTDMGHLHDKTANSTVSIRPHLRATDS